jgi:predicted O-methyltransferase YrrM
VILIRRGAIPSTATHELHIDSLMQNNPDKSQFYSFLQSRAMHAHGSMDWPTLSFLYDLLSEIQPKHTVETGCGASTIAFAAASEQHIAYCVDDRDPAKPAESSVDYVLSCPLLTPGRLQFVFGPTQLTLPTASLPTSIDAALIDGPHGFPFPELEYFYFYPRLKVGGLLILDDLKIPSIRRLFEFLREDEMFDELAVFRDNTAFLLRTERSTFSPHGDSWWEQRFNQRRLPRTHPHFMP